MQRAAVNKEEHRKIVSSKKAKTGGGSGSAMPLRQNGRQAKSEVSSEHNIYVTKKADITPGAEASLELRMGYHKLLSTLKESNKTCILLLVIHLTMDNTIVEPEEIPTNMSALMRHFMATSKIRDKTRSVWETARLGFNGNFEMTMNCTDYNLRASNTLLTKKRLQLPFTETICYLQFVENTIDTDSAHKLIQGGLKNIDPEAEHNWVLYRKVPWEGYPKEKFNNKKEEFESKILYM